MPCYTWRIGRPSTLVSRNESLVASPASCKMVGHHRQRHMAGSFMAMKGSDCQPSTMNANHMRKMKVKA